jgi:hypothetical protein
LFLSQEQGFSSFSLSLLRQFCSSGVILASLTSTKSVLSGRQV